MDDKGRFKDNICIERLWRTLKGELIYLKVYETGKDLAQNLTTWLQCTTWTAAVRPLTGRLRMRRNSGIFRH